MSRKRLSKEERLIAATSRRAARYWKPPFKGGEYQPSPSTIRMWEEEQKLLEDQERRLKQQNEDYEKMLRHLGEAQNLKKQALKREAGLKSSGITKQQKAKARHQRLCEIAREVMNTEKLPLRMTDDWLAKKVQARAAKVEGLKIRGKPPSTRTIKRALKPVPSNKV
jgi:hypothetical protein